MKSKTAVTVIKTVSIILLAVVFALACYLTYLFMAYKRVDDNIALYVENQQTATPSSYKEFNLLSWNVGFGAYSDDYTFFMDGGKESWAFSEQAVKDNLGGVVSTIENATKSGGVIGSQLDFICFQEVDVDGTRSYHVNEKELLASNFTQYGYTHAINYNSPYIIYPFTQPHGANKSGLMTLSKYAFTSAMRRQLPIETGLTKVIDLDRCYSVNRFTLASGKTLVIINLHLSAYSSDGSICDAQLEKILTEAKNYYDVGNYVVCAGDFNKDILGDYATKFGVEEKDFTWNKPLNTALLEGKNMSVVAPYSETDRIASVRLPDKPYEKGDFVMTVDGFLVSSNVKVVNSGVIDVGFKYSDHNPVYLKFKLN